MRFSAFDAATLTGVASGLVGEAPRLETWGLGQKERGLAGLALLTKLNWYLHDFKPDMVFIEEPLPAAVLTTIGTTLETTIKLYGLVFLIETVCSSHDIPTVQYRRQAVLKHFTGASRFPEKNGGKEACLARCAQLRWPAKDFEQADAAALWDYGCAQQRAAAWLAKASDRPMRQA